MKYKTGLGLKTQFLARNVKQSGVRGKTRISVLVFSSGPSQPTSNLLSKAANTELISIQEILFPMHILGPKPNGKLTNGFIC